MTALRAQSGARDSPSTRQQRAISRGVGWTAVGAFASKGAAILGKLILAALLLPQHFGLVGMVLVFTQIAKTGADLGLRQSLIQRKRDGSTRLLYDSAFWFLFAVGLGVVAAMWIVGARLLVWFYDAPELHDIAVVMSLGIVFQNLQVVPETILARMADFKAIILSEILGAFIGAGAAVILAYNGAGAWSLVAQLLVSSACTAAAMFLSARWLPRLRFATSPLHAIRQYSSYILGSRMLLYMQQNLDYLLIGKLMGAYSLGIYSLAFLITETLRAHIYWIVSRVVFPTYSRIAGDSRQIATIYCGTVRYMTLAMFPASILLILYADEAIPALFKDAWLGAVAPIRILAVASMIVASTGTAGEVLKAIGKPNIDFSINLYVTLFVAFPALWAGIQLFGVEGAAWAVVLYCSAARVLFHVALRRAIGVGLLSILAASRPAIAGCLLMLLCTVALSDAHWVIAAIASSLAYSLAALPAIYDYFRTATTSRRQNLGDDYKIVVILGPDGAGKTTLVDGLESRAAGLSQRLYLGMGTSENWRLRFVRIFYEFHSKQTRRLERVITAALLWYLLFPIELIARRLSINPRQRSAMLLIDRLPGQPFIRGGLLLRLYRILLPRPDVIVLLQGDPEKIAARKPDETSPERTVAEIAKWEDVARQTGAPSIIRLDTTRISARACTDMLFRELLGRQRGKAAFAGSDTTHAE